MSIEWHIEKRKIKDLKEYSKNPRKLTKDQATHLQTSLEKFGIIDKPFINHDNTIIGGHQRLRMLKKLGYKEIDVMVPSRALDDKEAEELNIRHNKNTGEFDFDILANDFDFGDLLNWGFTAEELLGDMAEAIDPATEEDSEVLEPGKDEDAITKLGDIYELNNHRLICGDSTLIEYIDKCLNAQTPGMMLTDPPYGVRRDKGFQGSGGFSGKGKAIPRRQYNDEWDNDRPSQNTFNLHISLSKLSVIFGGNFFADILPKSTHWIVWDKKQTMPTFGDCELAWTNSERKSVKKYEVEWNGLIGKEKERFHPTQKPLKLFTEILSDYWLNGIIFDPFLGSGTTLIAAEQLNRTCYGIELSQAYCDIIVNRWKKYMTKAGKPFTIKRNGEPIQWAESSQASQ